jgi:hypothetical protein
MSFFAERGDLEVKKPEFSGDFVTPVPLIWRITRLYGADGAFGGGTESKGLVTGFEFGAAAVPRPTYGAGIAGLTCLSLAGAALWARRLIG